jgi:hypothetical protein
MGRGGERGEGEDCDGGGCLSGCEVECDEGTGTAKSQTTREKQGRIQRMKGSEEESEDPVLLGLDKDTVSCDAFVADAMGSRLARSRGQVPHNNPHHTVHCLL